MENKKKLVRLNCKVNSMSFWNLRKLAKMSKYGDNVGKVIDMLVRDKMISLRDCNELIQRRERNLRSKVHKM